MQENKQKLISNFKQLYRDFDKENIDLIFDVYDQNIRFSDPVHEIVGLYEMKDYFVKLASGLKYCRFEYLDEMYDDDTGYIRWVMSYSHPSLRNSEEIQLNGISQIKFNDKIYLHEDFYDMGAMVYEHIPLLSAAIKTLKTRLAN